MKTRIVTSEQLAEGYLEKIGMLIYERKYRVIGKTQDGNFVVEDPNIKEEQNGTVGEQNAAR